MTRAIGLMLFIGIFFNGLAILGQNQSQRESIPYLYATYAAQKPGADLAKRFGFSNDIGAGMGYKTTNNWMYNAEATYIFGKNINENPLSSITNNDGTITDIYGEQASIIFWQRGMHLKATIGKIIPVFACNTNSGIYLKGSLGLLQHKIWIENRNNNTPQIQNGYEKGYDRLCNGLAISEFIGWQNWSKTQGYNFFAGFEFTHAYTQNRRDWDFESNAKINTPRLDIIYALKIGWYIPFKRSQSNQKYYYN